MTEAIINVGFSDRLLEYIRVTYPTAPIVEHSNTHTKIDITALTGAERLAMKNDIMDKLVEVV